MIVDMFRRATLATLLFTVTAAFAQESPAEFIVQIVRPSQPGASPARSMTDGGGVSFRGMTTEEILTAAFHKRSPEFVNLPAWARSDQFDITAKGTPNMTEADLSLRLKSLLRTEFKLAAHEEKQPGNAFVITEGKSTPRLELAPGPEVPGCKRGGSAETLVLDCESITIDNLIGPLTFSAKDYLDRPVINMTGLTGTFRLRLEWAPQKIADVNGGLTIFQAFTKQLGLSLEPRKVPVDVLVIDHIEKPTGSN